MIEFAYILLLITPIAGTVYLGLTNAKVRNVAAFVVFAWLFLPLVAIKFAAGIPIYDKAMAIEIGVILGVLMGRSQALWALRPSWIDLPMVIWCLVPIISSLSNGLGLYDGLAAATRQTIIWGGPYLIGRAVFGGFQDLFELAQTLFLGAVAYFPLVLFESRMAPQLHLWVYGVKGRVQWETADFWGPLKYKPGVFLESNLELTPLMGVAALCGVWLWKTGRLRWIWGMRVEWFVAAAALACVLGKSLGGVSLTVVGGTVLYLSKRYQSKVFLALLLTVAPIYMVTRTTGMWSGQEAVNFLKEYVSQRRAESFDTRLINEDRLVAKALERPLFGWGGWGRNRVYDDNGNDISLTDGLWVYAIGTAGLVGLAALFGSLLLPAVIMLKRADPSVLWHQSATAGVFVLMVVVVLHSIDSLANGMPNPIYFVTAGGLASLATATRYLKATAMHNSRMQRLGEPHIKVYAQA